MAGQGQCECVLIYALDNPDREKPTNKEATMCDIKIVGRGIAVNDTLREHVTKSVGGAVKVFDVSPMSAEVVLRHGKGKSPKDAFSCEVTVTVPKSTIRVAESSARIESAIDSATSRVSRQLRKYKTKIVDRHKRDRAERGRANLAKMSLEELDETRNKIAEGADDSETLIREKHVPAVAMDVSEAMVQCDLLGHDFYVFRDIQTDEIRIVYRRENGGYGLIVPE